MYSEQKLAWYKEAAARGNLEALEVLLTRAKNLGDWSFLTLLPPQILKILAQQGIGEAVQRLQEWAQQDSLDACIQLGKVYEQGQGVQQNKTLAAAYYYKAAKRGDAEAFIALSGLAQQGIIEAVQKLRDWAQQDSIDACMQLGQMYEQGQGVRQDKVLATEYYGKAAKQKSTAFTALCRLAGQGVGEAVHCLQEYAQQGSLDAYSYIQLGRMYEQGKGVQQDKTLAAEFYSIPAERGYAEACTALCVLAKQGIGDAIQRLILLAEQGKFDACTQLGQMYERGEGVTQDRTMAVEYYIKASKLCTTKTTAFDALCGMAKQGIDVAVEGLRVLEKQGPYCYCKKSAAILRELDRQGKHDVP